MVKRYREPLGDVEWSGEGPVAFTWRGRTYRVERVLGHWREDPGWWRRADGRAIRIRQVDLWRVEARNGRPERRGVYELVRRPVPPHGAGGAYPGAAPAWEWHLQRVWD